MRKVLFIILVLFLYLFGTILGSCSLYTINDFGWKAITGAFIGYFIIVFADVLVIRKLNAKYKSLETLLKLHAVFGGIMPFVLVLFWLLGFRY